MTAIYVDATPIIALGTIGELERLTVVGGTLVVLPAIQEAVTSEPARANLLRLLEDEGITTVPPIDPLDDRAMAVLDEATINGDVRLIGAVLGHTAVDEPVAVISDDRRLRTVAGGLGARVTGTIGVIVRAVEAGLPADEGKQLVRRVDRHGLHLTGELIETADRLLEAAGGTTESNG